MRKDLLLLTFFVFAVSSAIPARASGSCLTTFTGPLVTLPASSQVDKRNLTSPYTRLDASSLNLVLNGTVQFPAKISGADPNLCFGGGYINGGYPPDTAWDITHGTAGLQIHDSANPGVTIENLHIKSIGDGIKVRHGELYNQDGFAHNTFTVKGVHLEDIRDDCIESDWLRGGTIEDSFLDGCYTVFAARQRSGDTTSDGRNSTWVINNTLAYMHDQIGVYKGASPGHSVFFKWDNSLANLSPKLSIHNTMFRVDSTVSETGNQFKLPTDKLVDCSNNTIVWFGSGAIPQGLLDWPSCFTKTSDHSVWDNAVTAWLTAHPQAGDNLVIVCNIADVDKDGVVNATDLSLLVTDFFKTQGFNPRSDINSDGIVDVSDYSLLVKNYQVQTGVCQ